MSDRSETLFDFSDDALDLIGTRHVEGPGRCIRARRAHRIRENIGFAALDVGYRNPRAGCAQRACDGLTDTAGCARYDRYRAANAR